MMSDQFLPNLQFRMLHDTTGLQQSFDPFLGVESSDVEELKTSVTSGRLRVEGTVVAPDKPRSSSITAI
jgi:hypothetical protein